MEKDRKVTITCTEKQLAMLEMVCDRYARLIQGQLENSLQEVCEEAWCNRHKTKEHPHGVGSQEWYDMRHNLEARLKEMEKDYWGFSGGWYNGIGYDGWADNLWDMHQVMRHARYLAMDPKEQEIMRGNRYGLRSHESREPAVNRSEIRGGIKMRKAKNRCADCTKWQAGDEWHSTFNPNFVVEAAGICSGTGHMKLNVERACPHFEKANRGIILTFNGV